MDVLFWDESNYMVGGLRLWERINRAWGPSYTIWYKLLSYIQPDSIQLYYLNYKLTTILVVILGFLFLIGVGAAVEIAFLLACGLLYSQINLPVWPHVSHFCLIIFFTIGIITSFIKSDSKKWALWVVGFFAIAHARPEYYLSFVLLFFFWFLYVFLYQKNWKKWYQSIVFVIVGAGHFIIGVPLLLGSVDRSGMAFAQHLAKNHYEKLGVQKNFWLNWRDFYAEQFGNTSYSFSAAFAQKPELVFWHIKTNLLHYFEKVGGFFIELTTIYTSNYTWFFYIKIIIFMVLFLFFYKNIIAVPFSRTWKFRKTSFFAAVFLALPTPIAILLIYPRDHYLLLQVPLLWCLIAILFTGRTKTSNLMSGSFILVLFFFCLKFASNAKDFSYFDLYRSTPSLRNVAAINWIKKQETKDSIRVMDNEGYFNNFLHPFKDRGIGGYEVVGAFKDYIVQKKINLFYVTPSLITDQHLVKDATFLHFLEHPEQSGFYKASFGNFDSYFIIDSLLIKNVKP